MGRDEMRAGDGDREAVAGKLKSALDEGRLDLHEYDERLQKTYTAKTYGDLNGLLDDLPDTRPPEQSQVQGYEPPVPSAASAPPRSGTEQMARWVGPYAGLILISTIIWGITSVSAHELQYFWPVWMLIPLVFGVWGRWWSHSNRSGMSERTERSADHERMPGRYGVSNPDRGARRAARRQRRGR